jgi:hypothetical protein
VRGDLKNDIIKQKGSDICYAETQVSKPGISGALFMTQIR